ncbi:hypothetical protein BU23DRAFT_177839 [Bimuria novae-zelandiae CBS 107.79]|uniref:2EXR domain-containing protein n=1 Tax=Bimuria novae-zelandiae CBS 107.79 TaxID=1447943 RepID=A0A6A5V5U0_9PLEO|nr:hypothetical protein BU23DRAFT_177839 [Bimuria novae-zelandiae CBS 107.79]
MFPFLKLPAELRNQIYALALTQPKPIDIGDVRVWRSRCWHSGLWYRQGTYQYVDEKIACSLFWVCKQISREAQSIFHSQNHFQFTIPDILFPNPRTRPIKDAPPIPLLRKTNLVLDDPYIGIYNAFIPTTVRAAGKHNLEVTVGNCPPGREEYYKSVLRTLAEEFPNLTRFGRLIEDIQLDRFYSWYGTLSYRNPSASQFIFYSPNRLNCATSMGVYQKRFQIRNQGKEISMRDQQCHIPDLPCKILSRIVSMISEADGAVGVDFGDPQPLPSLLSTSTYFRRMSIAYYFTRDTFKVKIPLQEYVVRPHHLQALEKWLHVFLPQDNLETALPFPTLRSFSASSGTKSTPEIKSSSPQSISSACLPTFPAIL